jgi:hypothetical protein
MKSLFSGIGRINQLKTNNMLHIGHGLIDILGKIGRMHRIGQDSRQEAMTNREYMFEPQGGFSLNADSIQILRQCSNSTPENKRTDSDNCD